MTEPAQSRAAAAATANFVKGSSVEMVKLEDQIRPDRIAVFWQEALPTARTNLL